MTGETGWKGGEVLEGRLEVAVSPYSDEGADYVSSADALGWISSSWQWQPSSPDRDGTVPSIMGEPQIVAGVITWKDEIGGVGFRHPFGSGGA